MPIVVTHLVPGSLSDGAARGALWLHRALMRHCPEIDSRLICHGGDEAGTRRLGVAKRLESLAKAKFDSVRDRISSRGRYDPGRPFKSSILAIDPARLMDPDSDILHLHWCGRGMAGITTLERTPVPTVLTVRDMWPMTGGCHYSLECSRYTTGCGSCPALSSTAPDDISARLHARKSRAMRRINRLVAISPWLASQMGTSPATNQTPISIIPNAVDTDAFQPPTPEVRAELRRSMGIGPAEVAVLFGAQNINDRYKGIPLMLEALSLIPDGPLRPVMFGKNTEGVCRRLGSTCIDLGFISNDQRLAQIYGACDLFVLPSLQEAFGKVVIEAQACGTPVVAFAGHGPDAAIIDGSTGWLASEQSAACLARTIASAIPVCRSQRVRDACRGNAVDRFGLAMMARAYADVYSRMVPA